MTPKQVRLVKDSFHPLAPMRDRLAALFFARLFASEPSLRPAFGQDLRVRGRELHDGLAAIVGSLDRLYPILPALEWLALQAARRGVGERDYGAIGEALLGALESGPGDGFTPELREAWAAACRLVSRVLAGALDRAPLAA